MHGQPQGLSRVAPLALAIIAIFAMLQWTALPLYPDEVALRLNSARLMVDGTTQYGLLPVCASNVREIGPLLYMPRLVLSAFDQLAGWHLLRLLPIAATLALLTSVALIISDVARTSVGRITAWALLLAGLIGLAGSGLALMRPEAFIVAQIALALFCWRTASLCAFGLWVAIALIGLNIFAAGLSASLHIQALIAMPFTLAACLRLCPRPVVMAVTITLLGAITVEAVSLNSFSCREHPRLEAAMLVNRGSPSYLLPPPGTPLETAKFRIQAHAKSLGYFVNFLMPPPTDKSFFALRKAINLPVILLGLLPFLLIPLIGGRALRQTGCAMLFALRSRKEDPVLTRLLTAMTGGPALIGYGALVIIAMRLIEPAATFYRVSALHLFAWCLIAVSAASLLPRWSGLFRFMGGVAVVTCLLTAVINALYFRPQWAAGYEGMSVASSTDWNAVDGAVASLRRACKIPVKAERIVVDDKSYSSLRDHHHLMPVTYVWLDELMLREDTPARTSAQRLASLRALRVSAIVARCGTMEGMQLPIMGRADDLCCAGPEALR